MDVSVQWKKIAGEVLSNDWRSVILLGAVDRGKSTFARYLGMRLLRAGRRVALIDADIGQKEVGAPATISLGYMQLADDGVVLDLAASYFIGDTSPAGHLLSMLTGTRRMFDLAEADCVLINTGGMIQGPGLTWSRQLIEILQPALIIGLERARELEYLLWPYRHLRTQRLSSSVLARTKTTAERSQNRKLAFAAMLSGARPQMLPFRDLIFQRAPIFNAKPMHIPGFLYAERMGREMTMVSEQMPDSVPEGARILMAGFEKHLLCALADAHSRVLGLGILQKLDFSAETVHFLSAVEPEQVAVLQFGNLYLDPAGTELGRFESPEKKRRPSGRRARR